MDFKPYVPAVVLGVLVVLSFLVIRPFILAVFLGAILAYVFYPIYRWGAEKLKINKTVVAFLICLIIFIIVIIPSFFFVKTLIKESYSLYIIGKQRFSIGIFESCTNSFCNSIKELSKDPTVSFYFQEGLKGATNWVIKKSSDFLISLPNILLNLFIVFFTLFYFLKDGGIFVQKISGYLSMQKTKYQQVVKRMKEVVYAVVYGYLFVALIQGALGAIGFLLFGVSSPLFWGIVMAFLALIPYLGTGIIWGPAALYLILDGVFQDSNWLIYKGIGLLIYGFLIVSSMDNFIKPKIIGTKAKVHPALILLGIFGGIIVLGPIGILAGPLVLSLTSILFEEYLSKRTANK